MYRKSSLQTLMFVILSAIVPAKQTLAQEAYIGEIKWVGFNFCPRSYAAAEGQLLPIAGNETLFSLLGTMYGGDGRTSFALPDLRGRSAIGSGRGPALGDIRQGQTGGQETVVINASNITGHMHTVSTSPASTDTTHEKSTGSLKEVRASSNTTANTEITHTGSNQPVAIRDPYIGLRACIALQGIYPSRN